MVLNPLPFRLRIPGRDSVGFAGVKSVTYRVDGLLHLADQSIALEWGGTETTEQLSFEKIGTDVNDLPVQWLELSIERIAGARVTGPWWSPRLELRARRLDAFDSVPSARGPTLGLRISRRDRALAKQMALAIDDQAKKALLELEGGDGDRYEIP